MIDILVHNEEDSKLTQLQSQLYYMDTAAFMDDPDAA